jgi:glutathione S-transferase
MHQLYYYPGNANLAPHIVLEEIGAPYELVLVDRQKNAQKDPEYLRLNPNGHIPTLVTDGVVLYESAAICLHLLDICPDSGLAPAPGTPLRGHFYKWLVYLTNTIQSEALVYNYPERHTTTEAGIDGVKAKSQERLADMFRIVDDALAGASYLLGEDYSVCDAYLLMVARFARRHPHPPKDFANLRRCLDRVLERPAVDRAFRSEGLEPSYSL